ncbi:MAG TPA: type II secretion system protein, partial [Candidatus Eisenbacteria bacterium]|nr:type II secretion system protein [Candidatus Eisenbacteria bacterium]
MHKLNARSSRLAARPGFTLIELLIVIGIIGFLAAAVLVAVDPVKRIQDSRDARRYSEANALLNAVLTKQADDRRLYAGPSDAPIITSAANSQVIVTSTSGIECDTSLTENFPGCNQALDTASRTVAGTVNNSADQLNGTGTDFLTSLRVGDTVIGTPGNGTCVIKSITDNVTANCVASPTSAYSIAT